MLCTCAGLVPVGLIHTVVNSSMEQERPSHVILASYVKIAGMVDRGDLTELKAARVQVGSMG